MKLTVHLGISAVAAVSAYNITSSHPLSITLFLSGIFMDLDHLFDYMLLSKEEFSIRNLTLWYSEKRWNNKIYIIFHSYELLMVLLLLTFLLRNNILIGLAIGSSLHLFADEIDNMHQEFDKRFSKGYYFFSYRWIVGFEGKNLLIHKPMH